jgi:hypothetical protein
MALGHALERDRVRGASLTPGADAPATVEWSLRSFSPDGARRARAVDVLPGFISVLQCVPVAAGILCASALMVGHAGATRPSWS